MANSFTYKTGSWVFGGWVGLVLAARFISVQLYRRRTDYEPDRGECFACARCFEFCPNELVRRGLMPASELPKPRGEIAPEEVAAGSPAALVATPAAMSRKS